MSNHVVILFGVFLVLFLLQSAGGFFQIKDYEKAVRRVNQNGTVGIGQKRGRLLSGGHIVILACGDDGRITGGEAMDGISFLARFHPVAEVYQVKLLDRDFREVLSELRGLTKKKQKYYKGYIQALEALEMRG